MSYKRVLRLINADVRERAARECWDAPEGAVVRFGEAGKSRDQEERYHAMIGDIARQWEFLGRRWHQDDMKRLLVDAFSKAMRDAGTPLHHDGRVVPSLDGERVVQLGIQTSKFYKREASEFIEYLSAFGSENGVEWSNEARHAENV